MEVPRETPLDRVEVEMTDGVGDGDRDRDGEGKGEEEGAVAPLELICLQGERHDVSRGGIIKFQWKRGGGMGGRRSEEEDMPFTNSDLDKSFDLRRRSRIMGCFGALEKFVSEMERLP